MLVRISKWGNSLALRIPAPFARETGIDSGTEVDLALEDGKLVITPRGPGSYSLDALLAQVTKENVHDSIDTGAPKGDEAW
jgi:antitoxin MazE